MTLDAFFLEKGEVFYKKRGGFANLKTLIKMQKAQNPLNSLILDGGDCIMGSVIAYYTKVEAMVPLVNNLGYDIVLPGNWEVI